MLLNETAEVEETSSWESELFGHTTGNNNNSNNNNNNTTSNTINNSIANNFNNFNNSINFAQQATSISTKDDISVISTQSCSTSNNVAAEPGVLLGIVRSSSDKKKKKKGHSNSNHSPYSINYRGLNIYQAAEQGNLPLCVLLWGMASAKRVNLLTPDSQGNTLLHSAALADSAEVVGFLLQQTKGDDIKLVESRNLIGETPLLRAMNRGVMSVAKALIEGGSDPLATDSLGNSIFTKLAKSGHVWCLNFMYHSICNMHGTQVALELMSTIDNEAHSPLDWAADSGNVNVVEFFIRKGLNPYRADSLNRTPLYWAVKSNRVEAARFLVLCGCDPLQIDAMDQSPMSIAKTTGNPQMIAVLSYKTSNHVKTEVSHSIQCSNPSQMPVLSTKSGKQSKSHAIYQHNHSSIQMTMSFFVVFVVLWLLTVFLPFYAWVLLTTILFIGYKKMEMSVHNKDALKMTIPPTATEYTKTTFMEKVKYAPEKGIGFWMATVLMFGIYIVSSFYYCLTGQESNSQSSYGTFKDVSYENIFHVGAISGAQRQLWFLWVTAGTLALSIIMWIILVWIQVDPGIVNTRDLDFEEVLAQSLLTGGPPPSSSYCRTTMVKKPMRSKYCVKSGAVVARMDHYCIWLNTTIGFGNHRAFVLFLLSHFLSCCLGITLIIRGLYIDVHHVSACEVLPTLLSRQYFFPCVLCVVLFLGMTGLGALSFEQCVNITNNMTTNEKLNGVRYQWITISDGFFSNRFDRGPLTNILEFWQFPGYFVDYSKTFQLSSDLTQENMMLNTSRLRTGLTTSHSAGQLPSGPPSIDLEMAVKNRADSIDSTDTSLGLELV